VKALRSNRFARLAVTIALLTTVTGAFTLPAAHASNSEVALSKKCNNAADITDNGRDVWLLCDGLTPTSSNIIEIAVSSGKVLADIAAPSSIANPNGITSNEHYVWIRSSTSIGGDIAQFATPSGKLVRVLSSADIPATQPLAITATASSVWIADQGERHLIEVSASTGRVTHVGAADEFGQPSSIAIAGRYMWVLDQKQSLTGPGVFINTVSEFTSAGRLLRVITLYTDHTESGTSTGLIASPDAIAATPSGLWVDSPENHAVEISAATGHVIRNFKNLPSLGQADGPHLMVVSGTHLWLVAFSPALYEFNTNTGHVTNVSKSNGSFYDSTFFGIAVDSQYVWVMNSNLGQLAQFRRSNDSLVRDYS
jgi:hypothetical protein